MTTNFPSNPIPFVVDLGSSLYKIIHANRLGKPEAFAITPGIVEGVTEAQIKAQMEEYKTDPYRSAWVQLDGVNYAIGEFALDLNGKQYHQFSKWEGLKVRLLALLGIAATQCQIHHFRATVALLLPRGEVNPPDQEARLEDIYQAAQRFIFRGEEFNCKLEIKVSSEGAGLFVAHASELQRQGINPQTIEIPVVIGGERNTSLLCYRGAKINPAHSFSDGDGFYKYAEQVRRSLYCGDSIQLPQLIQAIAQGRTKIRVAGTGMVDIQPATEGLLDSYAQSIKDYLKAKMPSTSDLNCICGGGGLYLIWDKLAPWFAEQGIPATYLTPTLQRQLDQIFTNHSTIDIKNNPAQPARFADALGLYEKLVSAQNRQSQSGEGFQRKQVVGV